MIRDWNGSLLKVENPTEGQLMYMKDLYKEEQLIDYMVCRWERKLNTRMTEADWKKYRREVELLGLSSWDIMKEVEDWGLI